MLRIVLWVTCDIIYLKGGKNMLEKGDIIYRNNLIFADNGKLDLKIGGHPTLNITDDVNGFTYFFLITSSRILSLIHISEPTRPY